jgi:hypothetical protein
VRYRKEPLNNLKKKALSKVETPFEQIAEAGIVKLKTENTK